MLHSFLERANQVGGKVVNLNILKYFYKKIHLMISRCYFSAHKNIYGWWRNYYLTASNRHVNIRIIFLSFPPMLFFILSVIGMYTTSLKERAYLPRSITFFAAKRNEKFSQGQSCFFHSPRFQLQNNNFWWFTVRNFTTWATSAWWNT